MAGTLLFKVKYEFLTNREITQGYRCDWAYDKKDPLYIIWSSFVGLDGVELKESSPVIPEIDDTDDGPPCFLFGLCKIIVQ